MKTTSLIAGLFLVSIFYCCNNAQREQIYSNADSINLEEAPPDLNASEEAKQMVRSEPNKAMDKFRQEEVRQNGEPQRKFIRTADLKFRVDNVDNSTSDIENIIKSGGGFVTYTNLTSKIDRITDAAVSEDSTLKSTYYTVTNNITLRVPNSNLDTVLKQIARNINYLDYRIIKADDVALQMLANEMWSERHARYERRMMNDIDSKGRRLNHIIEGENELADRESASDEKVVANMSMSEQIRFSTIQLSIYQTQQIRRELLANDKNIKEYEPGFGQKLIDSLAIGWNAFQSFVLFLAKIWGLIIFAVLIYILYRYYRRNSSLSFEKIQPNTPKE